MSKHDKQLDSLRESLAWDLIEKIDEAGGEITFEYPISRSYNRGEMIGMKKEMDGNMEVVVFIIKEDGETFDEIHHNIVADDMVQVWVNL
jgi:UDP-N-acetyl-D-mannosaminuronate dehydrogenase